MKKTNTPNNASAFSLVELLVVIGVIGIIAAIAVPQITAVRDSAAKATNQRNAQTLASVFAAAQSAGLDFYVAGNEAATIQAIVTGGKVSADGPMKGVFFGLPNLSAADQVGAAIYMELNDPASTIIYSGP